MSPLMAVFLTPGVVGIALFVTALRAANPVAVRWLGVSVVLGFVACLWTMLVVVFDKHDRPPRVLRVPLALAIVQVACLIVGGYYLL